MPLVFVLLLSLLFPSVSYNATPEDEYKRIQEKLAEQKKKLNETQQKEYSILGELDDVNSRMGKIETELRGYRRKLRQTESDIAAVEAEISKTTKSISRQKEWIKRKLRTMQRYGNSGDLMVLLLSTGDLSQLTRIWKYLEAITVHENSALIRYRESLKELDEKHTKLEALRESLASYTEKVKTKEGELTQEKRSKEALLSTVRDEKAGQRRMLAELKEASKKLLDLIRESARTDTYSATGFSNQKGRLPWPVEGSLAMPYGSQKDPQFDTPVFRNGIHIKSDSNSDTRAVYGGKVIFAELFKGFGQLIIINHGSGYHTLYGNLSEIFSRVGDIIKENQVIGRVGTSGTLNAPGLYFEIRYKGKPLDPTQWLRHKRR